MLGLLVIINSLYKGIQWYNGNTASNVAMDMLYMSRTAKRKLLL